MSTTTFGWCRDGQDFSCLLHRESCREVSFVLHYTCDCQCRAAKERGFTDEKRTTTRLTLSRLNRFPLQRNWPSLQEICCFLLLSYFFWFSYTLHKRFIALVEGFVFSDQLEMFVFWIWDWNFIFDCLLKDCHFFMMYCRK